MNMKHLIYGMSIFAVVLGFGLGIAGCEDDSPSSATDFKLEYPKKAETTDTLVLVSGSQALITAIPQPAGSSLKAKSIEWISGDKTIVTVNQYGIAVGTGDFESDTTAVITVKANVYSADLL
ncbi:hypothetical protein FACS1894121_1760 [Bacteroidia bacterium]|nr:hypothetical protein FACS1894121_1760 [Bacteroidia bacterium]